MMRRKWVWFLVGGVMVMILVAVAVAQVIIGGKSEEEFEDRGVVRVNIGLAGVSLEEINGGSKDVKYEGNAVTIYEDGETYKYSDVEVKGRRNGTWIQEKKPYQIKFKEKVDLFGMGKARKWYLLANATDATNLRTETSFYIAKMLDEKYPFTGKFIELYINNEYQGLYYVTHAMEINKQVVDLKDSLGVLVELDNFYGGNEKYYETQNGELFVVKDLVNEDNEDAAMEDFIRSFNELEKAIEEKDYEKISELADVRSFVNYYLLSEFTVNPDAYWTSFYFYKDGPEDKIHAGPGWDFDLTLGSRAWGNWLGDKFYSPTEKMIRKQEIQPKEFYEENHNEIGYQASQQLSKIMFKLMEIPEFEAEVKKVFTDVMSGRKNELLRMIKSKASSVEEVAKKNNERWERNDFWEEVNKMLDWIEKRYDYFEQEYGEETSGKDVRFL